MLLDVLKHMSHERGDKPLLSSNLHPPHPQCHFQRLALFRHVCVLRVSSHRAIILLASLCVDVLLPIMVNAISSIMMSSTC
jgi:hypothetical protein